MGALDDGGGFDDDAVFWQQNGVKQDGQPRFSSPTPIKCKWTDTQERFVTAEAEDALSRSVVYIPNNPLGPGWLWKGLLSNAPSPPPDENRIRRLDTVSDIDNEERLTTAYL